MDYSRSILHLPQCELTGQEIDVIDNGDGTVTEIHHVRMTGQEHGHCPEMRMQDASPSDQDTETQAFQRRRYIGHVERRIRGQQVPGVRQTLQTEHSIQSGGLQVHQTLLQLCRPYDSRMQDYNNRCGEGA